MRSTFPTRPFKPIRSTPPFKPSQPSVIATVSPSPWRSSICRLPVVMPCSPRCLPPRLLIPTPPTTSPPLRCHSSRTSTASSRSTLHGTISALPSPPFVRWANLPSLTSLGFPPPTSLNSRPKPTTDGSTASSSTSSCHSPLSATMPIFLPTSHDLTSLNPSPTANSGSLTSRSSNMTTLANTCKSSTCKTPPTRQRHLTSPAPTTSTVTLPKRPPSMLTSATTSPPPTFCAMRVVSTNCTIFRSRSTSFSASNSTMPLLPRPHYTSISPSFQPAWAKIHKRCATPA